MVQFAGAVTAIHVKKMALDEDAVAVRPVGAAGTAAHFWEPPVTVSNALLLVLLPLAFETNTLKSAPLSVETVDGVV
jgi:hypothetical protein